MLDILEIIHRPSFETHAYWNRDIFFRIAVELQAPALAEVEYELSIILQGRTLTAEWLKDVGSWCRTKIVRNPNPFLPREDEPCYLMDELPTSLERGRKRDGWLHFRSSWLPDGELAKCKLRLTAVSNDGASSRDLMEGSFRVLPGEWKVIQKEAAA